ncbi:hypothetical protein V6N12_011596 [Hibiscus sabdariffa]|uniref:Uncharacterized protein n=1 Tax=Hibiscus sabdariffa TaxID=183260 RepID=A0ABR2AZ10_9ROSI
MVLIPNQFQNGSLMLEGASPLCDRSLLVHVNPKKLSRKSNMLGNLHVGSGRAFLRYPRTLLLLANGTPLLAIANLFWNNLFRRDNFRKRKYCHYAQL